MKRQQEGKKLRSTGEDLFEIQIRRKGRKILGWRTTGRAKGQKIPSASIPRRTSSDHPRPRDIILLINEFLHLRLNFLDRLRYLATFHSIRSENDERVHSVYPRAFVKRLITGGCRSMRERSARANLNTSRRPPTKEQWNGREAADKSKTEGGSVEIFSEWTIMLILVRR